MKIKILLTLFADLKKGTSYFFVSLAYYYLKSCLTSSLFLFPLENNTTYQGSGKAYFRLESKFPIRNIIL